MPVTNSAYYNDPALGQAFSNLASAFAPPSGADLAGYALANERKQAATRLGQLFDYTKDPNFNQTTFDRMGVASGQWNPSQSYYGIDAKEQGDTTRKLLEPVAAGATRFVPQGLADMYDVPNQQTGVVSLNQGERATLPNGQVLNGAPKPLSETEMKASILGGLPIADRQAAVLSDIPVETVMSNGQPQFVRRSDAIGKAPAGSDSDLVEGTANVNGKIVEVYRRKNERQYVTADGQPVPADVQVFDRARPTGTNEQVGMKNTEAGDKAGMFYNRAAVADSNINQLSKKGYTPSARDYELMLGGAGDTLPLSLSNNLVSPEGRRFYSNGMGFMMSVLRPDTGAAFGKEEFQSYARIFLPLPGDDPQTLHDKAVARATALSALQGTSRGAADAITNIMLKNGVPVPPELKAHMYAGQQNGTSRPNTAAPAAPAAPAIGAIEDGHRFKGGNPADPNSWEPVN